MTVLLHSEKSVRGKGQLRIQSLRLPAQRPRRTALSGSCCRSSLWALRTSYTCRQQQDLSLALGGKVWKEGGVLSTLGWPRHLVPSRPMSEAPQPIVFPPQVSRHSWYGPGSHWARPALPPIPSGKNKHPHDSVFPGHCQPQPPPKLRRKRPKDKRTRYQGHPSGPCHRSCA